MSKKITINADLQGIQDKLGVIRKIDEVMNRTSYPHPGWDGFKDSFRCLDSDAPIWVQKIKENPNLDALHLVVENAKEFKGASPNDYQVFNEILTELTDPEHRYDKVKFTYEIHDGEMIKNDKIGIGINIAPHPNSSQPAQ